MRVLLANPRGFCAGVDRAISIVKQALTIYGLPIYVYHELVHNKYVVESLRQCGAIFVDHITKVPNKAILIFSAHGVSKKVRTEAYDRCLNIFDATCPLVTKVHMEVARASRQGIEAIIIGHSGHPEVKGTMGQYNNTAGNIYLVESTHDVWKLNVKNPNKLYFMTQTTLSVNDSVNIINALRKRFPLIIGPHKNDICYATSNRQEAVRNLANHSDIVLVVGSKNSSNANRLSEIVKKMKKKSYLIEDMHHIKKHWFQGIKTIGITAGASAPEILVQQVVKYLRVLGADSVEELFGYKENIIFEIPKKLRIQ